jgi:hypothetical protein
MAIDDIQEEPEMKWQYLIIQLPTAGNAMEGNENRLNNLGSQGWELVTIFDHRAYLKRPAHHDPRL